MQAKRAKVMQGLCKCGDVKSSAALQEEAVKAGYRFAIGEITETDLYGTLQEVQYQLFRTDILTRTIPVLRKEQLDLDRDISRERDRLAKVEILAEQAEREQRNRENKELYS